MLLSTNRIRRDELVGKIQTSTSRLWSKPRVVVASELLDSIERRETSGLVGFSISGKSSTLELLKEGFARRRELVGIKVPPIFDLRFHLAINKETKQLDSFLRSARDTRVAFVDEVSEIYRSVSMREHEAFVDAVLRLHEERIPIVLVYHRIASVNHFIEIDFPFMRVCELPISLSNSEAIDALTEPFEGTGVELSSEIKATIMRVSGRYPAVLNMLAANLIELHKKRIWGTEDAFVIEDYPVRLLYDYVNRPNFVISEYFRTLELVLSSREKALLNALANNARITDYSEEIGSLAKWGVIDLENNDPIVPPFLAVLLRQTPFR